jgi:hypothetical protein
VVEIRMLETVDLAPQLSQLIKEHDSLYWAVAWATENSVLPQLLKNSGKIKRVVVGTHFCQTSPDVLE